MPARRKPTAIICIAVSAALVGCGWMGDVIVPGYLINASGTTLSVSVSVPLGPRGTDLTGARCRLDPTADPVMIASTRAAHEKLANEWRPAKMSSYDAETCSATMSLPPDSALVMFRNGTCSDYRKYLSNPHFTPSLSRLHITGAERSIELADWDTAKAFKASRWRNDCRLVVK
jgi:hypothetical protein